MTYQAIAFDLDGTLLNSKGQILDSSKQAIQAARNKGIKVILVTGRHHTAVKPYYYELDLDTPVICCNGTYVYQPQTDEVLAANPLSAAQAEKVISVAEQYGIHLLMYSRNTMNYMQLNPHRSLMDKAVAELPPAEFSCEWSWIDRVDVANNGNSKGGRLLELLNRWQIDPQNVIAFGDNHNDTSMLTAVGLGVAMGNAEDDVKRQVKRVTLSNDENGIQQVLNELL